MLCAKRGSLGLFQRITLGLRINTGLSLAFLFELLDERKEGMAVEQIAYDMELLNSTNGWSESGNISFMNPFIPPETPIFNASESARS